MDLTDPSDGEPKFFNVILRRGWWKSPETFSVAQKLRCELKMHMRSQKTQKELLLRVVHVSASKLSQFFFGESLALPGRFSCVHPLCYLISGPDSCAS